MASLGIRFEDLAGRPTLVAIGNFDGVHLGHQAVLTKAVRDAIDMGLTPVALTFEPHPTVAVGRPAPACLTTAERKIELIGRVHPEIRVVVQHFDAAFASLTPEQFVRTVLVDKLRARGVRVGENFRFGAHRSGDLQTLFEMGRAFGFEAQIEPLLGDDHGRYSSTRARECIARGDLGAVRRVLGRPHALCGKVVEGQRRARTLGFPTANLCWVQEALPPHGVYAVAVDIVDDNRNAARLSTGVCNIGVRPTVDAGFAVEVHLFDVDQDLYGRRLRTHLIHRIRSERKFPDINALKAQIAEDALQARASLAGLVPSAEAGTSWF
jgi:riboflavin kinase/FMN adenylyltransferase